MRKKKISVIALIKSFALLLVLSAAYQAVAQAMAPPHTVSEDGPDRPIPHDRPGCGNSSGANCCTGVHFTRRRGPGSWDVMVSKRR